MGKIRRAARRTARRIMRNKHNVFLSATILVAYLVNLAAVLLLGHISSWTALKMWILSAMYLVFMIMINEKNLEGN